MINDRKCSDIFSRTNKPVILIVLLICFLSIFAFPAEAQERTVKVGVHYYEPIIFLDSDGKAQGFSIDVIEFIAAEEGWQIEYVPCTWSEGLEKLENGEIDVLPAIAYSEERGEMYDFTNEMLLLDWGQIYTRSDFEIQSITELDQKTVIGLEDGIFYLSYTSYSKSFGISSNMVAFDDYAAVLEALEKKEADAGVIPRSFKPSKEYDVYQSPIIFAPIEERFAVPKDKNQDLVEAMDKNLILMKGDMDSVYYRSQEKWFGTQEEQELPEWFGSLLVVGGGLLVLLLAMGLILNSRVKRKTAELSDKNDELKLEISEHKKAEKALRSSEQKYSSLVEKGNDGIVIIQDYVLKFTNSKFSEIIGYSKGELIGKPFINFVSDEFKELVDERYEKTLRADGSVPSNYEFDLVSKNEEKINTEIDASLIEYMDRPAYMAILRDVSERKTIEEALKASEEKYSTLVEKGDDGIIIVQDGIVKFANHKMAELVGRNKEDVVGSSIFEYIPEEYRENTLDKFKTKLKDAGNIPIKFELEMPSTYSFRVPVEINASKIEHLGEPAVMATIRDISDRKQSEEILRQSEEKFRSIFHASSGGMAIFSPKGDILDVNPALCRFLDYSEEELLKQSAFDSVHPDDRSEVSILFKELVEGKKPYLLFEKRFLNKDGSTLWGLVSVALMRDVDGNPLYVIGLMQDITDSKKAEEELGRSNELKGLFTDILSHDLLNPAGIIKGFTELLLDVEDDEQKINLLKTIERNNDKSMELIENASKFAKLESVEEIDFQEMDISSVLNSVIENFSHQIENNRMTVDMKAEGTYTLLANPVIEEVFANLISNAIKYGPQGAKITIDVLDEGDSWKVTVADCGEGISDENKDAVFERFKRADKSGVKGTGLGLAIVKRIIELHGGKVGVVDNPEGMGSVFWVTMKKS